MSMSLDGFIADAKGGGEWMFRTQSEEGRKMVAAKIASAGLHLAGSKTFKQWIPFWPKQTGPAAEAMNGTPKAVFARSGDIGPLQTDGSPSARVWGEAEVIGGDLKTAIARLKEKDGKFILAQGGIGFAQHLVATGLVDEYWIVSHPIALGNGQQLFNKLAQPLPLKVIESNATPTDAIWTAYQPAEK
jgi:dihydrofolate reductase